MVFSHISHVFGTIQEKDSIIFVPLSGIIVFSNSFSFVNDKSVHTIVFFGSSDNQKLIDLYQFFTQTLCAIAHQALYQNNTISFHLFSVKLFFNSLIITQILSLE